MFFGRHDAAMIFAELPDILRPFENENLGIGADVNVQDHMKNSCSVRCTCELKNGITTHRESQST